MSTVSVNQPVLTPNHAYVLACVVGFWACGQFLGGRVMGARRKYKIPYPNLYANPSLEMFQDKSGKIDYNLYKELGDGFNRVQRGHQHMFEHHSDAVAMMLTCAVFFPLEAAVGGALYIAGNIAYGIGYSQHQDRRYLGEALYFPGMLIWIGYIAKTGYHLYNNTPIHG